MPLIDPENFFHFFLQAVTVLIASRGPSTESNRDHFPQADFSRLALRWFNFGIARHVLMISSGKNGSSTSHKLGFVVQFGHSIRS